jgi:hypothetical protein
METGVGEMIAFLIGLALGASVGAFVTLFKFRERQRELDMQEERLLEREIALEDASPEWFV